MDAFVMGLFLALITAALLLELQAHLFSPAADAARKTPQFKRFRNNYLCVYSLMMAGDWMQGPYIYALYEHYGMSIGDIGQLFIAGFGSSMVFGTVVGSLADRYGRKGACLLYVVSYSLSCLTKHWGDFRVLLLGRILGGISCSLLFSSFESWLIAEHFQRGFAESLLNDIFSKSAFLGAGLMAILSGLAGNILVEALGWGPVAPFDFAILMMTAGGVMVVATWGENYGDASGHTSLLAQFRRAGNAVASDPRIALLGAMQSLFEASMYTFVFLWTPALSPGGEKIPHGIVFACFMTACMAGSALTGLMMRYYAPEVYMAWVFAAAAAALAVPFLFHLEQRAETTGSSLKNNGMGGIQWDGRVQLLAFCCFEACVGVFWPSMMAMRVSYVPEESRSTIMNMFRVPLNLFVCLILYKVSSVPLSLMFGLCVAFLSICVACQLYLNAILSARNLPTAPAIKRCLSPFADMPRSISMTGMATLERGDVRMSNPGCLLAADGSSGFITSPAASLVNWLPSHSGEIHIRGSAQHLGLLLQAPVTLTAIGAGTKDVHLSVARTADMSTG